MLRETRRRRAHTIPICIIIFNAGYVTPVIRLSPPGRICTLYRFAVKFLLLSLLYVSYVYVYVYVRVCNAYLSRVRSVLTGRRTTARRESREGPLLQFYEAFSDLPFAA